MVLFLINKVPTVKKNKKPKKKRPNKPNLSAEERSYRNEQIVLSPCELYVEASDTNKAGMLTVSGICMFYTEFRLVFN